MILSIATESYNYLMNKLNRLLTICALMTVVREIMGQAPTIILVAEPAAIQSNPGPQRTFLEGRFTMYDNSHNAAFN